MIRRIASIGITAVAVVALVAAPATAADEVGLSLDGASWSSTLVAPLFDPAVRWVPGDTDDASFFVRNQGPSDGEVTVDVSAVDSDDLLADDAFLVEARIASGPWIELDGGTTTLDSEALETAEDADVRVDMRATFRPHSTRENQSVSLRVTVFMEESGDVGGVDEGDGGSVGGESDGSTDGVLPDTGSALTLGMLWTAAGLIGAGLALARPRRSRREVAVRG